MTQDLGSLDAPHWMVLQEDKWRIISVEREFWVPNPPPGILGNPRWCQALPEAPPLMSPWCPLIVLLFCSVPATSAPTPRAISLINSLARAGIPVALDQGFYWELTLQWREKGCVSLLPGLQSQEILIPAPNQELLRLNQHRGSSPGA